MSDIKVITICGSMKFSNEMMKISEMLDRIHHKKIDICDAIYVVNVDGYVGSSTKNEIEYAKALGKEILSLEPLQQPDPREEDQLP